jgi:protein Mpv17
MLKVACDQGLLSPVMTVLFFTFMKVLEDITGGLPYRDITPGLLLVRAQSAVSCKFLPTMRACYCVWPLAHVINFSLVPSSQRILYINAVAIGWTAFLSLQSAASATLADAPADPPP